MKWIALVTWVITAGGGFALLAIWLKNGGMRQSESPGDRIRPPRLLTHFALAATGLVIWIIYLASDSDAFAWIALALLVIVALLGFSMLAIWLRQRGVADAEPAERHFPTAFVAGHGVLAATTLVLVALVAAGVGGS
jgi:manganese efflux pump family protein